MPAPSPMPKDPATARPPSTSMAARGSTIPTDVGTVRPRKFRRVRAGRVKNGRTTSHVRRAAR
jgi:hypothetical protein